MPGLNPSQGGNRGGEDLFGRWTVPGTLWHGIWGHKKGKQTGVCHYLKMAPAKRPSRARVMIVIVMYLVATVLRCRERRSDTGCGWWPSLPILKQKAWIQVLVNHSKLNSVMIILLLRLSSQPSQFLCIPQPGGCSGCAFAGMIERL